MTELVTAALKAFTAYQETQQKTFERDSIIVWRKEEREAWQLWIDEIKAHPVPNRVERARINALRNDFLFYQQNRKAAQAAYGVATGGTD